MMTIEYADGRKIFSSGTFITLGSKPTRQWLEHKGERIEIIWDFIFESASPKQEIRYEVVSSQVLRLKILNFDRLTALFSSDPDHMGTIGGEKLWMVYQIHGSHGGNFNISYSFYIGG